MTCKHLEYKDECPYIEDDYTRLRNILRFADYDLERQKRDAEEARENPDLACGSTPCNYYIEKLLSEILKRLSGKKSVDELKEG